LLFGGRTIARNADWKNNLTLLAKDVQTSPNSARIRYAYGSALLIEKALKEDDNKALKEKDLDAAIEQLQKGVSILSNYNDAWYHLGIAYKEKNDTKNAVAAFDQARALKAFTDADHLTSSGIAYGMNGQYDKSIADLKRASELDPKSPDAWNNLGLYLSEAGQKDEALSALATAIALKKDFDKAYYNRGNAYAKTGDFATAMKDYQKALEINPTYSDAFNNMGNCYAAMQQPLNAKPWFEKAVNADPTNAKALLNLGVTLNFLGDTLHGKEYIARAQSLNLNR
jgi:tetratricopeptide (TPR) repeat protein